MEKHEILTGEQRRTSYKLGRCRKQQCRCGQLQPRPRAGRGHCRREHHCRRARVLFQLQLRRRHLRPRPEVGVVGGQ